MDAQVIYYLAGPMTGLPNHNFDAFERAATELRTRGLKIETPHDYGKELTTNERDQMGRAHWLRLTMRQLLTCHAIILMPGWECSLGARRELDIALDLSMEVWIMRDDGSMTRITGGKVHGREVSNAKVS